MFVKSKEATILALAGEDGKTGNAVEGTIYVASDTGNMWLGGATGDLTSLGKKDGSTYALLATDHIVTLSDGDGRVLSEADVSYNVASENEDGLLSKEDKQKLDNTIDGAQKNQNAFSMLQNVNDGSLPMVAPQESSVLYVSSLGSYTKLTASKDADTSQVTLSLTDDIPTATSEVAGLMTAEAKAKLDGVEDGANKTLLGGLDSDSTDTTAATVQSVIEGLAEKVSKSGDTITGALVIKDSVVPAEDGGTSTVNDANAPLRVRGVNGLTTLSTEETTEINQGVSDGPLYLQYGSTSPDIYLGANGDYRITENGGRYTGTADIAAKAESVDWENVDNKPSLYDQKTIDEKFAAIRASAENGLVEIFNYPTKTDFPVNGTEDSLYLDESEYVLYRWVKSTTDTESSGTEGSDESVPAAETDDTTNPDSSTEGSGDSEPEVAQGTYVEYLKLDKDDSLSQHVEQKVDISLAADENPHGISKASLDIDKVKNLSPEDMVNEGVASFGDLDEADRAGVDSTEEEKKVAFQKAITNSVVANLGYKPANSDDVASLSTQISQALDKVSGIDIISPLSVPQSDEEDLTPSSLGDSSLAVGVSANASHENAIALGANSTTIAKDTLSIGQSVTDEEGNSSWTVTRRITGVTNPVDAQDAATKGYVDNIVPAWGTVTDKPFETLGDGLSVADGVLSASGETTVNSIAPLTVTNSATAVEYGLACGDGAAAARNSVVLGHSSRATSSGVCIGFNATMNVNAGTAIGNAAKIATTSTTTTTGGAIAIGASATASGDGGSAIGPSSMCTHAYSTALGYHARTTREREVSFGYTVTSPTAKEYTCILGHVTAPENDTDAANKAYVDSAVASASGITKDTVWSDIES